MLNPVSEALKGATDVPLAILALLFCFLSFRKNRPWSVLFLLISCAAWMGALVHIFALSDGWRIAIWIVLYVFLFELIRRFVLLMISEIRKTPQKEQKAVWLLEAGLYLATVVWMFAVPEINDIYVFCVFIGCMILRLSVCLFTAHPIPKKVIGLFPFLLAPFLLQAMGSVIPYAVVAEHLILCAALCYAFSVFAKNRKI